MYLLVFPLELLEGVIVVIDLKTFLPFTVVHSPVIISVRSLPNISLPTTVNLLELSSAADVIDTTEPFTAEEIALVPIVMLPAEAAEDVIDTISL